METNPASSTPNIGSFVTEAASRRDVEQQNLNAGDFLDLLITQLTHQDPLDPMDDKAFMAQMAQFSSLDEMTNLNQTMTSFVSSQQAVSNGSFLGREVSILTESGDKVTGLVTSVTIGGEDAKPKVTVDGKQYDAKRIQEVRLPQSST